MQPWHSKSVSNSLCTAGARVHLGPLISIGLHKCRQFYYQANQHRYVCPLLTASLA